MLISKLSETEFLEFISQGAVNVSMRNGQRVVPAGEMVLAMGKNSAPDEVKKSLTKALADLGGDLRKNGITSYFTIPKYEVSVGGKESLVVQIMIVPPSVTLHKDMPKNPQAPPEKPSGPSKLIVTG